MSILKDGVIEKLNQQNYDVWKFKVEMYLQKEDLYEVVINDPPNPITDPWNNKNRKARAIINLLIEDNQIIHVKNLQTARECWNALRAVHERATLSSKLFLLRKLYSTKLAEGGDVVEHLTQIYQLRDKLTSIGEDINDRHLSALMLCSLPPSFDTLITALESRDEHDLSPEFIRSKLIDEYSKRKENKSENKSECNSVLKVKFKPKPENSKFCRYCKRKSHMIEECWHLKNKNKDKATKQTKANNVKQTFKSGMYSQDRHNADRALITESEKKKSNDKIFTLFIGEKSSSWCIDSGCSTHVCNDRSKFHEFNYNNSCVTIANGQEIKSLGHGSVKLNTINFDNTHNTIILKNVLYVPEIETNLISVKGATENGCVAIFENNSCKIMHEGKTCIEGYINNNLYECKVNYDSAHTINMVKTCENKNCINKWHIKLGHRNISHIKQLVNNNMANGITLDNCKHDNVCETCILSKLTDNPYPKKAQFRATKALELVHTDLCGPMKTPTVGGKYYFLTFIDDFSRFTIIYLLRNKDEVFSKLKEYIAMTSNKFGRTVQAFRSDNGGEYTGNELDVYLRKLGIDHQFTVPYSASQNGIAERKNRTLVEMARCLLKDGNLPNSFWGEAINTAVYLQNRLPTSSCELTPYELWSGRKPDLSILKPFGCRAYAYVQKVHRGKLDNTAQEGIFVGYDNRSKGYRICTNGKNIIISRTVKFIENEKQAILKHETSQNNDEKYDNKNSSSNLQILDSEIDETDNSDVSDNSQNIPRRSQRSNKGVPPDRFAFTIHNKRIDEPKCWDDIVKMQNPVEKENWINATLDEINSLKQNDTWELVEVLPGMKVVGCKWAFKAKYNSQGHVEKYKARLVAKGFSQKYGIDYDETFAPVASHTTLRSFLAMSLYKNLSLRHVDIKTAFLHGKLSEDVYMHQPEGYVEPEEQHKVCKLKKAIYGLKQAARAWNLKLNESLLNLGFNQSQLDKCLYKRKQNDITTYILVYVDDLLIAGNDQQIDEIINKLKQEYPLTDLGEAKQYLGININRPDKNTMTLDQMHKIQELVNKYGLENSKPTETPMETGYIKLNDEENLLPENTKYRQAVGALLYISTVSRPDISVAVNILSRRNERPRAKDWEAVKRLIRYLKTTIDIKLTYNNTGEPVLRVYSDSDWGNDPSDRKSTTGNLFYIGANVIYWISKKQKSVSMSSAEAEYISAASAAQEVKWLINLFGELDIKQDCPITLYEDNLSCIKLAESDKFRQKTKHIELRYHLIRDLVEHDVIKIEYVGTEKMIADILTKPLPKHSFKKLRFSLMNNKEMPSSLRRGVGEK